MLMRVHTRVSSPHAEHSAIKGQQSRVEQSLVLNCLSEVGGFLTNFYWTACSSWVGALLVLSEAVFCLHKLLAPHAVPNTLHKLQAGYLIWRAFFFFFFLHLWSQLLFLLPGRQGHLWSAQLALDSSLSRDHSCFQEYLLKGAVFLGHRQLVKLISFGSLGILHLQKRRNMSLSSQVICTSEQEFIFPSQQWEPQKNS